MSTSQRHTSSRPPVTRLHNRSPRPPRRCPDTPGAARRSAAGAVAAPRAAQAPLGWQPRTPVPAANSRRRRHRQVHSGAKPGLSPPRCGAPSGKRWARPRPGSPDAPRSSRQVSAPQVPARAPSTPLPVGPPAQGPARPSGWMRRLLPRPQGPGQLTGPRRARLRGGGDATGASGGRVRGCAAAAAAAANGKRRETNGGGKRSASAAPARPGRPRKSRRGRPALPGGCCLPRPRERPGPSPAAGPALCRRGCGQPPRAVPRPEGGTSSRLLTGRDGAGVGSARRQAVTRVERRGAELGGNE